MVCIGEKLHLEGRLEVVVAGNDTELFASFEQRSVPSGLHILVHQRVQSLSHVLVILDLILRYERAVEIPSQVDLADSCLLLRHRKALTAHDVLDLYPDRVLNSF